MSERDRVLDAFRNCITEPKCKDCPWTECETIGHDTIEIPRDLALAVMRELVAQEPRVLTLKQVRDEADHMYLEKHSKTGSDLYGCAIRGDWDGYGIELLMSEYDTARERWSDYGKTWRCWTSRPDEKRRAETPWH